MKPRVWFGRQWERGASATADGQPAGSPVPRRCASSCKVPTGSLQQEYPVRARRMAVTAERAQSRRQRSPRGMRRMALAARAVGGGQSWVAVAARQAQVDGRCAMGAGQQLVKAGAATGADGCRRGKTASRRPAIAARRAAAAWEGRGVRAATTEEATRVQCSIAPSAERGGSCRPRDDTPNLCVVGSFANEIDEGEIGRCFLLLEDAAAFPTASRQPRHAPLAPGFLLRSAGRFPPRRHARLSRRLRQLCAAALSCLPPPVPHCGPTMAVDAPSPGADATAPPPAPPVPAPRRRSAIVVHPPAPTSLEATESTLPTFAMPDAYDSDDGAERLSRFRRNPAVLVGAGVTAGVLGAGLLAFNRGDSLWSQRLMRMRVVAQV